MSFIKREIKLKINQPKKKPIDYTCSSDGRLVSIKKKSREQVAQLKNGLQISTDNSNKKR